jgi:hypothetical protein
MINQHSIYILDGAFSRKNSVSKRNTTTNSQGLRDFAVMITLNPVWNKCSAAPLPGHHHLESGSIP